MPAEDAIFLWFVWLCLAGPLIMTGLGFLFRIQGLMILAVWAIVLLDMFNSLDGTSAGNNSDPQLPESRWGNILVGVALMGLGIAVGLFFAGAAA